MEEFDKKVLLDRYATRIEKFGHGVDAIGEPKGRQAFYFDFLLQVDGFSENDSVLDVGCGYGDLRSYMHCRGWNGHYVGVDINPMLIEEGILRQPGIDLRTVDIQRDNIDEEFDWVICCHALTSKTEGVAFLTHFESMIRIMWKKCRKGLVFNLLSPLADFTNPVHARPNFGEVLPIICTLTRRFALRHDYMPFEYAVYAYKDERINNDLLIFSKHDEHFLEVRNRWGQEQLNK